MMGPAAIAILLIFAVFFVLYFLITAEHPFVTACTPLEEPKNMSLYEQSKVFSDSINFSDFAKTAKFDAETEAVIEAANLPEEKFATKAYTRQEIYAQAIKFSQDYAAKHPNRPYVTADFLNSVMEVNDFPTLGKYAGNFFRNRKLFKPTSIFINSNYAPSKGRRIQVYAYVGPQVLEVN